MAQPDDGGRDRGGRRSACDGDAASRGLPPLAGIATMEEAMRPGLAVEECVRRLKRYHYALRRLHQVFTARIPAEPQLELKTAFSLHAHLCAEHAAAVAARVGEMREPPLGLEAVPDPLLEVFFDEILGAPSTEELVAGLYGRAVPALRAALERHLCQTNPLADHPTVRLCRFALLEIADMERFGSRALAALVGPEARDGMVAWTALLDRCLAGAGALDGADPPAAAPEERVHSARPYVFDGRPRRDARFPDPYNMGVNAEAFLYDERYAALPKTLMMYYKRLREIDVPEVMAAIIAETPAEDWGYYRDMSRQLWDEARHALMGQAGFAALGIDWPNLVRVNHTWSLGLNTQLSALDRHAVLYFIEQGLMTRTGKRFEWEVAAASGDALARLFQDYDWADEVLHARIGRDRYVARAGGLREAVDRGDRCWSRVLMDWERWRQAGLTRHENWWPDLYRAACARWGIAPDPDVEAFDTSYEGRRADLKTVSG